MKAGGWVPGFLSDEVSDQISDSLVLIHLPNIV